MSWLYESGSANEALAPPESSRGVKPPAEARGCGQPVDGRAWQDCQNGQEEIPAEAQLTVFRVANEAVERVRPPMSLTLALLPSSVLSACPTLERLRS